MTVGAGVDVGGGGGAGGAGEGGGGGGGPGGGGGGGGTGLGVSGAGVPVPDSGMPGLVGVSGRWGVVEVEGVGVRGAHVGRTELRASSSIWAMASSRVPDGNPAMT